MKFSSRTDWAAAPNELSKTLERLKNEGQSILDLTNSNPTRAGFQYLNESLLERLTCLSNLQYDPDPHGLKEARKAVQTYYKQKGVLLELDQIFLTANTSEAYTFVFRLLFEQGDILLAPKPSYPLLDYLAGLLDITLQRYDLLPDHNWDIDLRAVSLLDEPLPRALLTVNPNNPTGNYAHEEALTELCYFCKRREMALISDEVFLDYEINPLRKPVSTAAELPVLTFTLSGISKILGLPQMKLSWLIVSGPEAERREAISRLEIISDTYLSAGTPAQNALPFWLRESARIQGEIKNRVKGNELFLRNYLSGEKGLRTFQTEGGWHAPLQLPGNQLDEEWAQIFLEQDRVLVHPGYLFDFGSVPFAVLSLLGPEQEFQEGIKRITKRVREKSRP